LFLSSAAYTAGHGPVAKAYSFSQFSAAYTAGHYKDS